MPRDRTPRGVQNFFSQNSQNLHKLHDICENWNDWTKNEEFGLHGGGSTLNEI